jgi:drug/metabolite transporter (DMT)-like permease
VSPTAGFAAIVFGALFGLTIALAFSTTGAASVCFIVAAIVSAIACLSCYLLGEEKGRPR